MDRSEKRDASGLISAQIDWVMNDLEKAKTFIQEMPGPGNYSPTVCTRVKEYD